MANECWYEMRVTGEKANLESFKDRFEDMNDLGYIFEDEAEMYDINREGTLYLTGRCDSSADYAFQLSSQTCPIRKASRDFNLFIEIFSEGDEFQEHYIIKCGDLVTSDAFDLTRVCKDDYESVEDLNEDWETNFSEEEFDAMDNDDMIDIENHYPDGFEYAKFSIDEIVNYVGTENKEDDESLSEENDDDDDWDEDDEDEDESYCYEDNDYRDQFIDVHAGIEVSGCHYATTELGDKKEEFEQILRDRGAIIHGSVVKKPGYLVVGKSIDHITRKLERALKLKKAGIEIYIVTEEMVLTALTEKS